LVGAGLLLQTFQNLRTVDLGYQPEGVLTFFVGLPAARYGDVPTRHQLVETLESRLTALPGVSAAGAVESLPLSGYDGDVTFNVEGRTRPEPGSEHVTWIRPTTEGYRAAMGLRIVSGRWVESSDIRGGPRVVVINQTLADRHFPGENPIGQRLTLGGNAEAPPWEIVGVVGDTRHFTGRDDSREAIFVPYLQVSPAGFFFAIRADAGRDAMALLPDVRATLATIDESLAPRRIRAMQDVVGEAMASERFLAMLLTLFAGVTLLLAVVGLYGVVAYAVNARLKEMGVRIALGARTTHIGRSVVGRSLALAGGGVVAGLILAAAGAPAMRSLLYGVGASDPRTLVLTAGILFGVAVLASAVPALRASRVDPARVLRLD
jgi:predicted permease